MAKYFLILVCFISILSAKVNSINDKEFKTKTASGYSVVDFYATWCGPCKRLAPVMDKLEQKYNKKMNFFKINVDKNHKIAKELKVSSIPAVFFFKDGKMIKSFIGFQNQKSIEKIIDSILK